MKASHPRTIGAFEVRSIVLFASLVLGGAAGAQSVPGSTARSATTAAPSAAVTTSPPAPTLNAAQPAGARTRQGTHGQRKAS